MRCPWCGGTNCKKVTKIHTKKFHGFKLHIFCFRITEKKEYWVCPNCGNMFNEEHDCT